MPKSKGKLHIWGLGGATRVSPGFRHANGEEEVESDSVGLLAGLAVHRLKCLPDMHM